MAKFTAAVRYAAEAQCVTPLRTGGADGEADAVLRRWDGKALIQATSLAGALREWVEKEKSADLARKLFGSQERGGSLVLTDGEFEDVAAEQTRPRVALDARTGTAEDGKKFDVAHIARGSKFIFELTWLGTAETKTEETAAVEELLAALHHGCITLGAQKNNGFGRVALTKVMKSEFDLTNETDRNHWLNEDKPGEEIVLSGSVSDSSRVFFSITGDANGLLVRAAAPEHTQTCDVTVNIRENETWVIPGASIKGAVRGRAEAIDSYLKLGGLAQELFGHADDDGEESKAGELRFEDVYLECEPHAITRIRIDRFTGGVMDGALFAEKPLCGKLHWTISAPNDPAKCGLLLFALRDLGLGLYNLGSGGSIGRGYLSNVTVGVNGEEILRFENNTLKAQNGLDLTAEWMRALKEKGGRAE